MYIAEDYNSPQSVYWCLKSFIAVTISEDNPFWRMEELPHPIGSSPRPDGLLLLHQPRHIMCNTPEHHFLLSSGQATKRNHKGREAKYGKFAYSSAFGFSVPVGTSLDQIAPDSTLAISIDGGESWKTCSDLHDLQSRDMKFAGEVVPTLLGTWRPFTFSDFEVRTTLVPPVRKYPGWHLRIHEVRWSKPPVQNIQMASGGFAVSAETSDGRCIYEEACVNAIDEASVSGKEGWWACDETSLVISESGACGAIQLTAQFLDQQNDIAECQLQGGKGIVIKPHANTNLMAQRTLIPAISTRMDLHSRPSAEGSEKESAWNSPRIFVTAVFGVDRNAGHPTACVWNMWRLHPVGRLVRQADGSLAFLD